MTRSKSVVHTLISCERVPKTNCILELPRIVSASDFQSVKLMEFCVILKKRKIYRGRAMDSVFVYCRIAANYECTVNSRLVINCTGKMRWRKSEQRRNVRLFSPSQVCFNCMENNQRKKMKTTTKR